MTTEQALALLLGTLIALIPNLVLKYLDKHKSKEEKENLEVDTLTEALSTMREHNKFLEDKLATKREEITTQNKILYDVNSQNVLLTKQISEMTVQLLDITEKLQECLRCIERENK